MAQLLKAGIDLLYVEDIKAYPPGRLDSPHIRAWHSRHQQRLDEMSRQFQVPALCSLKSGSPAEQILKALRSKASPELVVVGTQGRKGLKRLLIGSVAEEVIRHSKRPVMVIGPVAQGKDQNFIGQKQLRILIATDLGKNSRAAEQYALSLAKRIGARAVLFHCLADNFRLIMENSMISGMVPFNLDEILARIREGAIESIKQKVHFFQKHGVSCECKVEEKAITSPLRGLSGGRTRLFDRGQGDSRQECLAQCLFRKHSPGNDLECIDPSDYCSFRKMKVDPWIFGHSFESMVFRRGTSVTWPLSRKET